MRTSAQPLRPGGGRGRRAASENAVVFVGTEPCALPAHAVACRGVSGKPVDSAWEVKRFLYRPEVLVAVWREQSGRVARRDPADRHGGARSELGVDVNHGMDADLAGCSNGRAWKDRGPGGEKCPVLDDCAVDVRVRSNEHVVAEPAGVRRRPRTSAFSMTTVRSPTSTRPSSAVTTAPKRIRAPAPTCTSPHKTAFGATYADGSTVGLAPRCSINMLRSFPRSDMAERCRRADHRDRLCLGMSSLEPDDAGHFVLTSGRVFARSSRAALRLAGTRSWSPVARRSSLPRWPSS